MSMTDKILAKEIIVSIVVLVVFGAAMMYTLSVFNSEGGQKVTDISQAGDKAASHVETHVKLVSIDPIKGDASARFEFEPSENLLGEDGTLKQDLKLYVNSANGKQELDFVKGKLMTPVEALFNMHDGQATEYPFDKYVAYIDIYITKAKSTEKKKAEAPPAAEPKDTGDGQAVNTEKKDEADSDEMAISSISSALSPAIISTQQRRNTARWTSSVSKRTSSVPARSNFSRCSSRC